jgi:hypothetical protein
MTSMQNFYNKNRHLILGISVGIVSVYLISSVVIEKRLHAVHVILDEQITVQEKSLQELAVVTGRGGVNELAESIVKDCTPNERKQFDTLLSSLDKGLSISSLRTLDVLFASCGNVFANRRANMAGQLKQEVVTLNNLETQKSLLTKGIDEEELITPKWQALQEKEDEIQKLFFSLVDIQGKIIKSLLSGQYVGSDAVIALREEATEVQNSLAEVTQDASTLRSQLIPS